MNQVQQDSDAQKMVAKWPSHLVARSQVSNFTGFTLSGKSLANMESRGERVPEKIFIGGKVAYRAEDLAVWLLSRAASRS
jgi:hypothetical protein